MSIINKDKLQIFGNGLFDKIKARFVDKTGENIIAGKTTILNGYIPSGVIVGYNNENTMQVAVGTGHYCGSPHKSIPADRHISHIVFAVKDNYPVGTVINGINIGIVRKSDNQVIEILKNNAQYPVLKNESSTIAGDRVVAVDIDKAYGEEVYVIFGASGMLWNKSPDSKPLSCTGGNTLPQVGTNLHTSSGNYIGRFEIYDNGIALRDLANSGGTVGVSREEFERHVSDNEKQYQTLSSSISTNTQNITTANQNISSINRDVSSNAQKISSLETNTAKKNSPNIFTSQNTFKNNSPVVDKYFPIKTISADGIDGLHDGATYCCNPSQGITNSFVSALVVPIHNSKPGDVIQASYFTVNAANSRTTSGVLDEKMYTVQDILYKGHYCIVIEVNKTFNYAVSFGFGIKDTVIVGPRRIGLLKTELPNSNNITWSSYNKPANGDAVSHLSSKFMIPYMITKKATSEVVTRFDLANNTVPMDIFYQIGEMKAFAIDMGETTEIGGKTWVRCEGQVVQQDENGTISVATKRNVMSRIMGKDVYQKGSFTLPVSEPGKYIYVCAR